MYLVYMLRNIRALHTLINIVNIEENPQLRVILDKKFYFYLIIFETYRHYFYSL